MSTWEAHGAGDNLLTWSSFDEMAWNEFEEGDDRIVPETESLTKSVGPLKDESHKKSNYDSALGTTKVFDQNFQRLPNCCPESINIQQAGSPSKGTVPASQEKASWSESTPGNGSGVSNIKASDTMNNSGCSSSLLSSFHGGSRESKKGSKLGCSDYEFQEAEGLGKVDTGYQDNDADIVNGSCHFFLSDLCPPGEDLEFFEGVHEVDKGSNMLEFGWGNANNLEDMDKLFLNNEPLLPQAFDENSDGMLWESSSPVIGGSPSSIYEPLSTQMGPEFRVLKGDLKGFEMKMEFVPCETSATSLEMETETADMKGQSLTCQGKLPVASSPEKLPLRRKVENHIEQPINGSERSQEAKSGGREVFVTGAESIEDDGSYTPKEAEKGSKARRHAVRRKRLEERSKRQISERKLAMSSYHYSHTNKPQLSYIPLRVTPTPSSLQDFPSPSAQISQITQSSVTESPSSIQCLHPVAYVHAGFGFPAHHMPIVVPSPSAVPQQLQQAQPVFIGYQPSLIDASKSQQLRSSYEITSQPPIGSSTMTPQEKIEKLRWRQKMQARLAVEQQQQLINQHLIHEQKQVQMQQHHQAQSTLKNSQEAVRLVSTQAAEPQAWNEEQGMKAESNMEEGDDSLAATVLEQLLHIASELDMRTRLCLRDGFRRLARSAMQRRAVGDGSGGSGSSTEPHNGTAGPESSSSSERSSNRRILTVADIVETETNPIDRFIAHLLFRKRHTPVMGPVHMNPNSCSNNAENSQAVLLHQSPWAWQTEAPLSEPAAGPSCVSGGLAMLQGSSENPHTFIDATGSSNPCLRFSGTSACVPCPSSSGLGLAGSSPVPPEAFSPGVVEDSFVDGNSETCPDTQSLSGYRNTDSMIRRHDLYSSSGGIFGSASLECLQEQKVAEQDRLQSGDFASDNLLPVDQKEGLSATAVNGGKVPLSTSKEGTTIGTSLRHTAKDKEFEVMDVDVSPLGTMPLAFGKG